MEFKTMHIANEGSFILTDETYDAIMGLLRAGNASAEALSYMRAEEAIPVYLTDRGPKLISCLKELRSLLGISLKEAKHTADKVAGGGRILLGHYPIYEAHQIKDRFAAAGSTVELISPLEMLARQAE